MFIAYWLTLFYFAYILQVAICNETPETNTPTTNAETTVDSVAELESTEEESTVDSSVADRLDASISVPVDPVAVSSGTTRRLTEEKPGKKFKKGKKEKKIKEQETDIDVNVVNANQDTKTDIKQIFVFEDSSDNKKMKTYSPEEYEKHKKEKNLRHHDDEYYHKYPHGRPYQKYCKYPSSDCADYYKNVLKCPDYCKNRYDPKYILCKPQCKDYYRCYEKCPIYCKYRYHPDYVKCPSYCKYNCKEYDDSSSSTSSSSSSSNYVRNYESAKYDGAKYYGAEHPKGYAFKTETNAYYSRKPFEVNIKETDEFKEVTINGKKYYYKNQKPYKKHH